VIATIKSATLLGIEGHPVTVEVHIGRGLPAFTVVGLPDAACRESRDRVRAAFASSELEFPKTRVTVNLAPSGVRKIGAGLDLAIAVAILAAQGRIDGRVVEECAFLGELGLDGRVRAIAGVLSLVDALDTPAVAVPLECVNEASLVGRHLVRGVSSLRAAVAAIAGREPWPEPPFVGTAAAARPSVDPAGLIPDLAAVRGQPLGQWAVEVSAAGGHHLLMIGPPGAGKTMLAGCLPGLLPALTRAEALEVTRIHSAGGLALPHGGLVEQPPFRAPHHTASMVSLVGGGTALARPGEISFACHGVLFMDELAEFPPAVLDTLRQPIEEGWIRVSRARHTVTFPADFLLVAAMNPCPCGEGGAFGSCRCSDAVRNRYVRRVSGPLLDRFDLRVVVSRPDASDLLGAEPSEASRIVAARVAAARALAPTRGVCCNADLDADALDRWAVLSSPSRRLIEHRLRAGRLSARGLQRVRRVARTLADLAGDESGVLDERHVAAALELRADTAVLDVAS